MQETKLKDNLYKAVTDIVNGIQAPAAPTTPQPPSTQPTPSPAPMPAPAPSTQVYTKPSELTGAKWTVMLPTGSQGDPDNLYATKAEVDTNGMKFFRLNASKDGVVFTAPIDGFHSSGSNYARCELREMKDIGWTKAAWSNKVGTHTMELTQSIDKIPTVKPHQCAAQIHDGADDILQIRLEGTKLMAAHTDGAVKLSLDDNYKLGTKYTVKIEAANSKILVTYNGTKTVELPLSGTGWYFKAGCYVQSNIEKGDVAGTVGEVTIYSVKVTHS